MRAKTPERILEELAAANAFDTDAIEANWTIDDLQSLEDRGELVDGDEGGAAAIPNFDLYSHLLAGEAQ